MAGVSAPGISTRLRSAQQLLYQLLRVPAGLALGDKLSNVSPGSCEVSLRIDFKFPDGRLQFGSSGREPAVEIVCRVVQRDRQLPDMLIEVSLVLPVAHEWPRKLSEV